MKLLVVLKGSVYTDFISDGNVLYASIGTLLYVLTNMHRQ